MTPAGAARATLRLSALAGALAAAVVLHGGWRLVRARSPWPRRYLALAARLLGARVRITGTPVPGQALFLSNHLSWLDIPLLAGATGAAFVARDDLARVPLIGWLCRRNRTIFVRRSDRMGVRRQIATLRDALAETRRVAIFPEGTTGDGIALRPFKTVLLAALDPPLPGLTVQPVRIDYGDATAELAWTADERGPRHARRVLTRRGRFTAHLHFLPPVAPTGDRKAIAGAAHARIAAAPLAAAAALR